jgi:uncharacterized protein YndB with AHSA1/START domain
MSWTHSARFTLQATPERVWRALTEPPELQAWFAEHAEVELRAGGAYRCWGRHTLGTPSARPTEPGLDAFEAPRRLAYSWDCCGVRSRVELRLDPAPGGATQLALAHEFERELALERAADLVDDHWRLAFGNLSAHLRHGADVALPLHAESAPAIRHVLSIEAPLRDVWSALVEPARLERWIASAARVEPRVGGAYTYGWTYKVGARDVVGGPRRILAFEPEQRLALDWPDWRGDPRVPDQRIEWRLFARAGGSRVEFEHTGFVRAVDWSDFVQGWWEFLLALRREVEQPAPGFALPEAVALLERTPRVLRAWFDGLPAGWLRADEGAATYSPLEIVAHLVHGEETDWIPRARRILEHGERVPFERYDRYAQRRLHAGATLGDLLALFEQRRAESLAALRALVPAHGGAHLDARGLHPALGAVSLRQLLAAWVVHDLSHLRQAARAMAQRYRAEVGPWEQFYPVLAEGPLGRA